MDIRILGVCNLENENFQNFKLALNPVYSIFQKKLPNVASYHVY